MFKKSLEAKSQQRLSGADRKKLKRTIKERFRNASDSEIDSILPPKVCEIASIWFCIRFIWSIRCVRVVSCLFGCSENAVKWKYFIFDLETTVLWIWNWIMRFVVFKYWIMTELDTRVVGCLHRGLNGGKERKFGEDLEPNCWHCGI